MRPVIEVVSPLPMQWEEPQKKALEDAGFSVRWVKTPPAHSFPRQEGEPALRVFMWADMTAFDYLRLYQGPAKHIVYARRYEHYTFPLEAFPWEKVSEVVVLNDFFRDWLENRIGRAPVVIHNGVDPSRWTFAERSHGLKIAMVGFVNARKNFPLAMQIMAQLGDRYELHVAGEIQDGELFNYLVNMGKTLDINGFFYGPVDDIDKWLEDKNYILCTSISEGWPNNVLEAMAKGIKPIVHDWPGSGPFTSYLFSTVADAVRDLSEHTPYDSRQYREHVKQRFGSGQFRMFAELCQQTIGADHEIAKADRLGQALRNELRVAGQEPEPGRGRVQHEGG